MNPSAPAGRGAKEDSRLSSSSDPRFEDPVSGGGVSEPLETVRSESVAALTADLKEVASEATRAIRQQGSELAGAVGDQLSRVADVKKAQGVDTIRSFARAIRSAASELENQSPTVAQHVRGTSEKLDLLSENISSRNVNELLGAATDLARAQPLLFFGGFVAAGFALARFLKSSAGNGISALRDPDPWPPS